MANVAEADDCSVLGLVSAAHRATACRFDGKIAVDFLCQEKAIRQPQRGKSPKKKKKPASVICVSFNFQRCTPK